jgi:hypothetical protein
MIIHIYICIIVCASFGTLDAKVALDAKGTLDAKEALDAKWTLDAKGILDAKRGP